jgi:hypothetical protein
LPVATTSAAADAARLIVPAADTDAAEPATRLRLHVRLGGGIDILA